jgi:hypothetical protein
LPSKSISSVSEAGTDLVFDEGDDLPSGIYKKQIWLHLASGIQLL